jgi:hypothetical protein
MSSLIAVERLPVDAALLGDPGSVGGERIRQGHGPGRDRGAQRPQSAPKGAFRAAQPLLGAPAVLGVVAFDQIYSFDRDALINANYATAANEGGSSVRPAQFDGTIRPPQDECTRCRMGVVGCA